MKDPIFESALADAMDNFIAFKRMQGYDYTGKAGELSLFDRFLARSECSDGLLKADVFSEYLASMTCAPSSIANRLSGVRQFSRYLHALRPESAVTPLNMQPAYQKKIRFYRIESEKVASLTRAASRLRPVGGVRPLCVSFLIGLLYSTGLRVNEALKLNLSDVDIENGTILVRKGKFSKDRLIALSESTLQAVKEWLKARAPYASTAPTAPLLVGKYNCGLTYFQARGAFKTLCGICGLNGDPPPRLHDLRHNYACRRIALWRGEGEDVLTMLPVLANAMGHVNFFATQIYIHVEGAALRRASERFAKHFK